MKKIKIGFVLLALMVAPAAFGWGYYPGKGWVTGYGDCGGGCGCYNSCSWC